MKKIIFELGANIGTDTQRLLNENPDSILYTFEPTHELLKDYIWPAFENNERVKILPFAVDIVSGFKKFNVSAGHEMGCSSLYEFSDNIQEKWKNRLDFVTTHSYYVPTITMKDFCTLYNINTIDYIHIDTQGNDLNCLMSFEDKINIVKEGKCEVAAKVELYKNTNNQYTNVIKWLTDNGFNTSCNCDDPLNHMEVDINFKRKC